MSDSEMWRAVRRDRQEQRAERLPGRQGEILALRGHGFGVRQLTEYQFRIDGTLDLFPTRRRFHHIPTDTRGSYTDALMCARTMLNETARSTDG